MGGLMLDTLQVSIPPFSSSESETCNWEPSNGSAAGTVVDIRVDCAGNQESW